MRRGRKRGAAIKGRTLGPRLNSISTFLTADSRPSRIGVGKGQGGGGGGKEPLGLLYLAIVREKSRACLFLLEHGADFKKR